MLSLRGVPPRGAADDVEELEEGEACPDDRYDGGGDAFFDPDVALSYIDEKLQHVLGHFQKDFEGGFTADNLGSKFGGYGSFLPTYQHSPSPLAQTRSSHMTPNITTPRSPYQPSAEIIHKNPSTSDLCKKERCSRTNSDDSATASDFLDSSCNVSDSKSLKDQIKVGSRNVPRKHAAIYSGLGLDISPSLSMEKSLDGQDELSPDFSDVACESPRTILQVMTCFPIPGGFLLSPLRDNVVQLTNKVAPLLKKCETPFEECLQSSLPPGHFRGQVAKQIKYGGKKKMSTDTKARKDKGGASVVVNKEVNKERPAAQEVILDMPASTIELKDESKFARESARNTCISGSPQENKDFHLEEHIGGNDLAILKPEAIEEEATKYTEDSGLRNLGTGDLAPKRKHKIKTGGAKCLEERDMSNHKSCSFDRKKKRKVKSERKFERPIADFDGNKDRNKDPGARQCDDSRNVPVKETFPSTRTRDDNSRKVVKIMQKEHQVNAAASLDFSEDDTHSSAKLIDRKNDTLLTSNHSGKKAKSHKEVGENLPNRFHGDMEQVLLENRSSQGELRQKESMNNTGDNNEFDVGYAQKEIPSTAKPGRFPVSEEQLRMPSTNEAATTNANTVPATDVIEDDWVCCDICQKWRLLPYGTNPSMLPKKWKCSMLYWLPGMNKCDISEDETTNALNASYVTPALTACVSSAGPHTAASSANEITGLREQSRKRKNADENGLVESYCHTPLAIPLMSNQQDPSKNKRTADGEINDLERDSVSKHSLRPISNPSDLVSVKQKLKHKNCSSHSNGGDLMERTEVHSKTKRGINQNEQKTSKKTRKEDWHQIDRDRDHNCDSAAGEVPDEPNVLPAKAKAMKDAFKTGDISLCKEKVLSDYDLLEKTKRTNVEVPFHKKKKEHPTGVERFDSCKKIVKEHDEINLNCVSSRSNNENLKECNSNILKSEEMVSKVDCRHGKVQQADTLLTCTGNRQNHELVADNNVVTGKGDPSEIWENPPPRQALDLAEATRKDVAYLQPSISATSSASKISSSRRNKSSQEAKDSPVESISSSPLRNFHVENINDKKDGTVKAYSSSRHSPVKYSSTEVGVLDNDQQAENIEEAHAAEKSGFHGSLLGSYKKVARSTQARVSAITGVETASDNNLPKASGRKDLPENDTGVGTGDGHLSSTDKTALDMEGLSLQPDQHLLDRRAQALGIGSNSSAHENKTSALRQGCEYDPQLGKSFGGKEKSQPKIDDQGIQKSVTHAVHLPMKEGKQEVCFASVRFDTSKQAQLRRSSINKGVQNGTVRQLVSNSSDVNPIRKDDSMVAFALKEARDLKHKANHLKNKGLELESTGLYFEAALKFLHVAFLLETPNFDSSRLGDAAAQSMKMYSETAKLCNFCAHEYERCKKMAAAALAYKCEEVAYLKTAYYKHPSASKDRQELQALVKITPGQSPSSSASDIDNINSHGLSKAPSTKDESSPQVTGSHLPQVARNQGHLLRLLAYINDVNCAFDATRKSQVAIASAAGSQERRKGVDDGFDSVRTVLDFNFNNVDELLRLVRCSMELICI